MVNTTNLPAKKKAGVLGATGSVGQRFILLLSQHPQFDLVAIGASSRSAGKKYIDACTWKQTDLMPKSAEDLIVSDCTSNSFKDCDIVFSGLDADVAGPIEKEFVESGLVVISNAKNYRRAENVPLIVPIANSDHLKMIENRIKIEGKQGFIICISNCSTAGLVAPLKPLVDQFGPLEFLSTTTLQAISGAGFSPGVSGIDILDNIVPYISGEEDKIEWEAKKVLGSLNDDATEFILDNDLRVSAQCNRVAVSDGHTECVSFKFKNRPAPSLEQIKSCLRDYVCEAKLLNCHSAPDHTIHVLEQPDRPQPRLDRNRDAGYGVSVGRIRPDPIFDYKMVILSHNTIIGAAGSGSTADDKTGNSSDSTDSNSKLNSNSITTPSSGNFNINKLDVNAIPLKSSHDESDLRQSAFHNFMNHQNDSFNNINSNSKSKFYLLDNNSESCESLCENIESSTINSFEKSTINNSIPNNISQIVESHISQINNNGNKNIEKNDDLKDDLTKFTTESTQSYSYTPVSVNSLTMRLNVLKRSLEILLENPEWLNTSLESFPDYNIHLNPLLSLSNNSNKKISYDNKIDSSKLKDFLKMEKNVSSSTLQNLLQTAINSDKNSSIITPPPLPESSNENIITPPSTQIFSARSNSISSNSSQVNNITINDDTLRDL
ncbi:hypothetical protein C6P40_003622, partial [Pichia californica]